MESQTIISVDARGLRCPLPVLRLAKALRENPGAALFTLIADDPAAAKDVPAFAREHDLALASFGDLSWRLERR